MPRPKDDTHQVATRVSNEAWEILLVGLVAERAPSMQELLRPAVEGYAEKLEKEPEVKAILAEVDKYQSRKHGIKKLTRKGSGSSARRRSKQTG